ncbi:hypothetical protein TNCV_3457531 [Trichonephila clavipes]|nr:hypothetical protein TNCV_3457531 [Trichonephila clavipes]
MENSLFRHLTMSKHFRKHPIQGVGSKETSSVKRHTKSNTSFSLPSPSLLPFKDMTVIADARGHNYSQNYAPGRPDAAAPWRSRNFLFSREAASEKEDLMMGTLHGRNRNIIVWLCDKQMPLY